MLAEKNQDAAAAEGRHQVQSDLAAHPEVLTESVTLQELQVGHICDAQDYLGHWHLSIVIDEKSPDKRTLHFLPFNKANRDEDFSPGEDEGRIAPLLTNTKAPETGGLKKDFNTLKAYLEAYRTKHGKKVEEFKSARPATQPSTEASTPKAKAAAKGKKGAQAGTADATKTSEATQSLGDDSNNQAQKMASGPSATKKSPANASAKADPNGALDSKAAGMPPMGQMFSGNPFAFKGLSKPSSMGGPAPDTPDG